MLTRTWRIELQCFLPILIWIFLLLNVSKCFGATLLQKIVSNYYHPQTKFAKVMFLHLCHSVHRGGMRGRGGTWQGEGGMRGRGACMAGERAWQGRHAWRGVCVVGGACVAGGHVWWGVCMAGGMHGRGHAWQRGMHATHAPPPQTLRDTVGQCAGGTHPTGIHSCFTLERSLP